MPRKLIWVPLAVLVLSLALAIAGAGCGNGSAKLAGGSDSGSVDAAGTSDSNLFGGDAAKALVIDPANPSLVATGPGATQQFTAHFAGDSTTLTATWTLDVSGIGTIDGTGLFVASGLLGGQTTVTAHVGNATAQTILTVVLHIGDNPGNVGAGVQGQLSAGGTADAAFAWLYPYDGTVFPRGLASPVLQFAGTAPDATLVQVSFSSISYQGFYGASSPGAVTLSPQLWQTITASASSTDAVKVSITKISGGLVTGPITETWTIAQGTLKGTVYYESRYSTPTDNGATMRIKPGAAQPDVLLGNCNVCHYVSADGSTIVAALDLPTPPITSGAYDLKNDAGALSGKPDETYTFGALYKDGSFLMSCGSATIPGIGNDGPVTSHLYTTATGAQIPAPGWDSVITNGAMPTFSPDGAHIVFNHFDTGMGHTLALMDFAVSTHAFSNLVDVVTDPNHFLGWPAFTPDSGWVVFDADSRSDFATWSAVASGSGVDAKSDLQIAHIASKTTASLDLLNGVSGGKYYLPFGETAEGHMNYDATVLPVAVGGYYWVVFTSRREYGNTINTADPYYNTPGTMPGALPWRKKLWVAALDIDNPEHPSASAHDVSHPAFYLPGQDLQTGNYRGFWALDPCAANGTTCASGDQCCSGYCRATSGNDGGETFSCVSTPTGCSQEYEKCAQNADCCACAGGAQASCINQFCACLGSQ
jgi:hypothetical protein